MITMIGVMLGGALGGMLRLWVGNSVSRYVSRYTSGYFPWGTLTVNLTAALMMGAAFAVWQVSGEEPGTLGWAVIAAGLLGGYSTVSTLSLQVLTLWQHRPVVAVAYLVASLGGGLAMVASGHLSIAMVMA
ncbi:fluoride efflux transporter FluC [Vreelandella azerica]|nr:CrcB family protein [Halomonas azerica]